MYSKISHDLPNYIHPRWCRISSINSINPRLIYKQCGISDAEPMNSTSATHLAPGPYHRNNPHVLSLHLTPALWAPPSPTWLSWRPKTWRLESPMESRRGCPTAVDFEEFQRDFPCSAFGWMCCTCREFCLGEKKKVVRCDPHQVPA